MTVQVDAKTIVRYGKTKPRAYGQVVQRDIANKTIIAEIVRQNAEGTIESSTALLPQ